MIPIERGPYPPEITKINEIDLSGKIAIVTGSSRGIGEEIAKTLASHKANIVLNSTINSAPEAEKVKHEIEAMGQKAIVVTGDVSKEQTAIDIATNAVNEFGHIDILVNNAGTLADGPLIIMSLEKWQKIIDINLTGPFLISREVIKAMLGNKTKGSIINISSLVGVFGNAGQANYGASKAGLINLGLTIAKEYGGKRGIRANSLVLGLVETVLTSLLNEKQKKEIAEASTVLQKKDIAEQVLYLASDRSVSETGKIIIMGVKK